MLVCPLCACAAILLTILSLVRDTSGAPGIALLNEAVKLETKPVPSQPRENPDRVAGTWVSEKGRRFEFHPDGAVSVNGAAKAGTWSWAKARNWNTMLVILPGKKTKEIFYARIASSESGKLRIYAYGTANGSLVRQ